MSGVNLKELQKDLFGTKASGSAAASHTIRGQAPLAAWRAAETNIRNTGPFGAAYDDGPFAKARRHSNDLQELEPTRPDSSSSSCDTLPARPIRRKRNPIPDGFDSDDSDGAPPGIKQPDAKPAFPPTTAQDKLEAEKAKVAAEDAEEEVKPRHYGLTNEANATVKVEHNERSRQAQKAEDWKDIAGMSQGILDGVYENGFIKPSEIQKVALPIIIGQGCDLIGQAQNGSGKTAAFSLGMLAAVDTSLKMPQTVCLSPTRELARQNHTVVEKLGKHTGITMQLVVPNAQGLRSGRVTAQILSGTPGKMQDLLKRRVISAENVRQFVLDEADVMISQDNMMGSQVTQIRKCFDHDCQILLFSATYPEEVRNFAKRIVPDACRIEVKKEDLTLNTIQQMYADCSRDPKRMKYKFLEDLYSAMNVGQSVIFVNTKHEAFELAEAMKAQGHSVALITGTNTTGQGERVDPEYRDRVMDEFREGIAKVLIATDVLARGIDVPAVTLVINYQLPLIHGQRQDWASSQQYATQSGKSCDMECYLHRIGRTGRFGLKGISINLCDHEEMMLQDQIRRFYNSNIECLDEDFEKLEDTLKELR